ncbi:MAG: chitobiase/beta-hexosaminidase C-terminal domain-containing protein [Planctomycetota bacterium]
MDERANGAWGRRAMRAAVGLAIAACWVVPQAGAGVHARASWSIQEASPQHPDPLVVHPYLLDGDGDAITIAWETARPATSVVEFGIAPSDGSNADVDLREEEEGLRTLHRVRLRGLRPGATYRYRVSGAAADGETFEGEPQTLRTMPPPGSPTAVAVFGGRADAWEGHAAAALEQRPDLAVHAGGLTSYGADAAGLRRGFFDPARAFLARVPIVAALAEGDSAHRSMLRTASDRLATVDLGNARIFVIDAHGLAGDAQRRRFEYQLAGSPAVWNIVVRHRSPLVGGVRTRDDDRLLGLCDRYGVDLVVSGDGSSYERSKPVREGSAAERGTVYVRLGDGCEDGDGPQGAHAAAVRTRPHFAMLHAAERTLRLDLLDGGGRLLDMHTIEKPAGPSNAERFAAAVPPPPPVIEPDPATVLGSVEVTLRSRVEGGAIRYTLDGSEPDESSTIYAGPVRVDAGVTVRARVFVDGNPPGDLAEARYRDATPVPPTGRALRVEPGLRYTTFEGAFDRVGDLAADARAGRGFVDRIDLASAGAQDTGWGVVFHGFIEVAEPGVWVFEIAGRGRASLSIAARPLLEDVDLRAGPRSGMMPLRAGRHRIRLDFVSAGSEPSLDLRWRSPGGEASTPVPASAFRR